MNARGRLEIVVVSLMAALVVSCLGLHTGYAASVETDLFSDNFDRYAVGELPPGWTGTSQYPRSPNSYVTSVQSLSPAHSFQLQGMQERGALLYHSFLTEATIIGYEFATMIDARSPGGRPNVPRPGFLIVHRAGWFTWFFGVAGVYFNHDTGRIEADDGTDLGPWETGRWYLIKTVLDRTTNLYNVWVDGVLAGRHLRAGSGQTDPIEYIGLSAPAASPRAAYGVRVYYDDVRVFTVAADPDPGIAPLFPDPNLDAAVRSAINKPTGPLVPSDVVQLRSLTAVEREIANLEGLQYCVNLRELFLWDNRHIADLSPLVGLTNLTNLCLNGNRITDVSPLAGLTNLERLWLHENQITDLSPLGGMTRLWDLSAYNNRIRDITPLSALASLTQLNLSHNEIVDLSPLVGLTRLQDLRVSHNQIVDLTPLAALTNLRVAILSDNRVMDITPLAGLNNLSMLWVHRNYLDLRPGSPAMQTIGLLQGRGTTVVHAPQKEVPDRNAPPVASFTFSPTEPIPGQVVRFDGRASHDPDGHIVSYAWQFGDGATGTGATPSHTYATAGTYTVRLTVTDNQGATGSRERTIQVGTPPPTLPGMPTIDKPGIYVWGTGTTWHITVAGSAAWAAPRPFYVRVTTNQSFQNIETQPAGAPAPDIGGGNKSFTWEGTVHGDWVDLSFRPVRGRQMRFELYLDLDGTGDPEPATADAAAAMVFLRDKKVNPPVNPLVVLVADGQDFLTPGQNFRIASGTLSRPVVRTTIEQLEARVR